MPQFDDKHVKLNGGIVVWDGITRPDTIENGPKAGSPKWSLKVVFEPNNPDLALYNTLSNAALGESQFRGVLPHGGYMPVGEVRPGEFGGQFDGWACVSFKTTMRAPDVYDEAGQLLDPMQYGNLIYGGQRVDVLAHCYEYNQKSKGIGAGLDGFAIIASANAPRQNFGGGGIDTAGAFAAGGTPQAQQAAPVSYQQPQQSTDFLPKGPAGPAGPAGPSGPAVEPKYNSGDGHWTRAQLQTAGYNDAQIDALPLA